ncbi:MAG: amidohydrolase family protein [Sandaracinaceae bacterium]
MSRTDLEQVAGAPDGDYPVVLEVSRSSDILRALSFARDYGLRLVISGGQEAWMVAPQLAAADVPVILRPMTNLPASFSQLHARYDNAAILHRAGVRVIIAAEGAHGQRNLRQEAGNAIATGMPRDAALRALTLEPARTFGVDRDYGTVAAGRVANLVVWTGDPFELTTWARNVFVRGREIPTTTRQTLLFERYRRLENVPRGQRGLPRSGEAAPN